MNRRVDGSLAQMKYMKAVRTEKTRPRLISVQTIRELTPTVTAFRIVTDRSENPSSIDRQTRPGHIRRARSSEIGYEFGNFRGVGYSLHGAAAAKEFD